MNPILFHICNIPVWLITLLPLRILYLISDFFYFIIYYLVRYRRRVVFTNLKNAFPEKSDREIHAIAKKFYHHLCDSFIESIYSINISAEEISKRYRFKNLEVIQPILNRNKSILMVCGHYGNWEWYNSMPLYVRQPVLAIYHPLRNSYFNELLIHIRRKFGVVMIPMKTSVKEMIAYSRKNISIISLFLADQRPVWSSIRYWTTFLNQETPVLQGSEIIAKKLDHSVVFMDIQKVQRGYYEIFFELISENPRETAENEITEAHTRILERIIRKEPAYWLWSHKRWKHKRADIEKRTKSRNEKNSHSYS